jgi:hypothetical protein
VEGAIVELGNADGSSEGIYDAGALERFGPAIEKTNGSELPSSEMRSSRRGSRTFGYGTRRE